jgi:hypothetical protein
MIGECVADRGARTHQVIEHARRQARVAQAIREQPAGPGRFTRALEHHGVAGDQRRGHRSARQREGKIERVDHHPHAVGLHHAAIARHHVRQRIVRQHMIEAVLLLEAVAVDVEEIRRLLHLAKGLHAVLADFERHGGGDVIDALLDDLRHAAQQPDPFRRGRRAPPREGISRRAHGLLHVFAAGLRERS